MHILRQVRRGGIDRVRIERTCGVYLRVRLSTQIVIWDLSLQRMSCIMVDSAASPIMMLNKHSLCAVV